MKRKTGFAPSPEAAPVVGNIPGTFAWGVLHERHPKLVQQVRDAFPYDPGRHHALDQLLHEMRSGLIRPLQRLAADRKQWDAWGQGYFGRPWADVPFLWAESYFYRKLLQAVGYFEPGIWSGIDPFGPFKQAESPDFTADGELATLRELGSLSPSGHATALMRASLWGNRADLSFRILAEPQLPRDQRAETLVADDSGLIWSILDAAAPSNVCFVADNAGHELLWDLVLIDHLLETHLAEQIVLHVKPAPYYVSDATTADVIECMRRLLQGPGQVGEIGRRLWHAMATARLSVCAPAYYCSPLSFHDMPAHVVRQYAAASITIMKGDLNYRRLVGDRMWPPTSSFSDLTAYFPGPVATLRILKSDVVVGIARHTLEALRATGDNWRTNGSQALIQARQ